MFRQMNWRTDGRWMARDHISSWNELKNEKPVFNVIFGDKSMDEISDSRETKNSLLDKVSWVLTYQ